MKIFKLFFFLSSLLFMFKSVAQTYPPYPTPGTTSVYYGIYPVNIEIPYGASSTSPETFQLQFYIVNQTASTYNLSNFSLTAASPPSPNPITVTSYTTDCGGVLKPAGAGGVCNIFANISAVNNGGSPMTMNFSFSYSSGRPAATQAAPAFTISFATGAVIPAASRTVTFVNNCGYDVWFGVSSGAVDSITPVASIQPPDPKSCADTVNSTDCYPGSVCRQVQASPVLNHCLWENPAPTGGGNPFHLLSNNGSGPINVDFPVYDNGISTSWNGGIAGRVGCSDTLATDCVIADCGANPSGTACPVPGGFATPSTLAEFTFNTQNPSITSTSGTPAGDTYDITVINGITVPTSMEPTTVAWGGASEPYVCGNPGASTTTAPLVACEWFNDPAQSADFVWVSASGTGAACPPACGTVGKVCGHTISGTTVSATTVCGPQLGYLTADAVCAIDSDFGAPFNCGTTVNQGGTNYTLAQIYGCSVGDFANSCYTTGASSACCGCQNWGSSLVPASTQSCNNISNSYWQTYLIASNFLPWVKALCPTAYSYPFDDASSTFTCQDTDADNNNVVDYTVTFCP